MEEEIKIETIEDIPKVSFHLMKYIVIGLFLIGGMFLIWLGFMNLVNNSSIVLSLLMMIIGAVLFYFCNRYITKEHNKKSEVENVYS